MRCRVEITWSTWHGSTTASSKWYATEAEAWHQVIGWARQSGWTPPRWWQWWRWRDTRVPPEFYDV